MDRREGHGHEQPGSPVACLIVDLGWGVYALTRVQAWRNLETPSR
jgi:hypothetical protein